jgi:hypothetical protein
MPYGYWMPVHDMSTVMKTCWLCGSTIKAIDGRAHIFICHREWFNESNYRVDVTKGRADPEFEVQYRQMLDLLRRSGYL